MTSQGYWFNSSLKEIFFSLLELLAQLMTAVSELVLLTHSFVSYFPPFKLTIRLKTKREIHYTHLIRHPYHCIGSQPLVAQLEEHGTITENL
jgi:hypothetical protein